MGGNFSSPYIREELLNHLHVSEVNNLMQQIDVIIRTKNEVILKNIAVVSHLNFQFFNNLKNQLIASTILDATAHTSAEEIIKNKISEKQDQGGFFEINSQNATLIKQLKNLTDISRVNSTMQEIRNRFNFGNTFKVENDQLLPNSRVEYIDMKSTNEIYNDQTFNELAKIYSDITHKPYIEDEDDLGQKADNTTALLIAGAVIIVGGIVMLKMKSP